MSCKEWNAKICHSIIIIYNSPTLNTYRPLPTCKQLNSLKSFIKNMSCLLNTKVLLQLLTFAFLKIS